MAQATLTLDDVLERRLVRTEFQPIVDIDRMDTVGYEALSRGPEGSALERPDALFAAAAAAGRTTELDWECRATAVRSAIAAGIDRSLRLFVNVEPTSFGTSVPPHLLADLQGARRDLRIVVEITERALATDLAAMIRSIDRARHHGYAVAIDDVGADPASLTLMPIIDPDVVKLDLRLVQHRADADVSTIARAVMAQAERTGALVVAEGVETQEHLDLARTLGAHLAQGWFFGRPTARPTPVAVGGCSPFRTPPSARPTSASPYATLPPDLPRRVATKAHLLPFSHHLEAVACAGATPPLLASTFQHVGNLTPGTMRRYRDLAARCSLVLAFGTDMPATPVPGVVGSAIPVGHPLTEEWVVVVLGPHEAAALVARDLGDDGPDPDRRFAYALTHRREVVVDVVRSLLGQISRP